MKRPRWLPRRPKPRTTYPTAAVTTRKRTA